MKRPSNLLSSFGSLRRLSQRPFTSVPRLSQHWKTSDNPGKVAYESLAWRSSKNFRATYAVVPLTLLGVTIWIFSNPFLAEHSEGRSQGLIPYSEVLKHNSRESCWVIIRGQVYDLTEFVARHPGGSRVIINNAGQDVTTLFEGIHSPAVLQSMLQPHQHLGPVDPSTMPVQEILMSEDDLRVAAARNAMPPLARMINLADIEEVARKVLTKQGWSYYRSEAEDGYSYRNNFAALRHYFFRPRILRKVAEVDLTTTILGIPSSLPIFVSPAAMAGLGHPEGEKNITRGAVEVLKKVEKLGFHGVMLTVDAPVLGRRELDMRTKEIFDDDDEEFVAAGEKRGGVAASLEGYFETNIGWDDVEWLQRTTKLPIIIKGIQTVDDCILATQYPGVKGVLLSNHGGRQADYAPAAIDVLYELRQKRPDVFDKVEVYVDGGFRRGTDVLKAICLGAKACGLGRPFLYANAAYGEAGVIKTVRLLNEEIKNAMQQIGLTSLAQASPDMVEYVIRSIEPPKPEDYSQ
ncbi:Cytochrome b2, mitochondrial precursor [Tulasnella sp. 418]|nr:Cytochrome b2, mitochondrial precursor [Tulasnella sp. 418]